MKKRHRIMDNYQLNEHNKRIEEYSQNTTIPETDLSILHVPDNITTLVIKSSRNVTALNIDQLNTRQKIRLMSKVMNAVNVDLDKLNNEFKITTSFVNQFKADLIKRVDAFNKMSRLNEQE